MLKRPPVSCLQALQSYLQCQEHTFRLSFIWKCGGNVIRNVCRIVCLKRHYQVRLLSEQETNIQSHVLKLRRGTTWCRQRDLHSLFNVLKSCKSYVNWARVSTICRTSAWGATWGEWNTFLSGICSCSCECCSIL